MTTIFYTVVHRVRTGSELVDTSIQLSTVQMNNGIEAQVGDQKTTVDIMAWLTRTALELIGQGGLGVSMDSLGEPIHNPLADSVKMMM